MIHYNWDSIIGIIIHRLKDLQSWWILLQLILFYTWILEIFPFQGLTWTQSSWKLVFKKKRVHRNYPSSPGLIHHGLEFRLLIQPKGLLTEDGPLLTCEYVCLDSFLCAFRNALFPPTDTRTLWTRVRFHLRTY